MLKRKMNIKELADRLGTTTNNFKRDNFIKEIITLKIVHWASL